MGTKKTARTGPPKAQERHCARRRRNQETPLPLTHRPGGPNLRPGSPNLLNPLNLDRRASRACPCGASQAPGRVRHPGRRASERRRQLALPAPPAGGTDADVMPRDLVGSVTKWPPQVLQQVMSACVVTTSPAARPRDAQHGSSFRVHLLEVELVGLDDASISSSADTLFRFRGCSGTAGVDVGCRS